MTFDYRDATLAEARFDVAGASDIEDYPALLGRQERGVRGGDECVTGIAHLGGI